MALERSKEWWLTRIDAEPDSPIGAGLPDMARLQQECRDELYDVTGISDVLRQASEI